MAFNGTLFTFGSFNVQPSYMLMDSYKITPNQRQDLDSYRDADGILRRFVVSHTASKIEFDVHPMSGDELDAFVANIKANYVNYSERNANCTYFDSENNTYKTGIFYLADVQYSLKDCRSSGQSFYNATKFIFTEY